MEKRKNAHKTQIVCSNVVTNLTLGSSRSVRSPSFKISMAKLRKVLGKSAWPRFTKRKNTHKSMDVWYNMVDNSHFHRKYMRQLRGGTTL